MKLKNIQTLLLNSSFEPLGVISAERAICLEFRGRAVVEEYHPTKTVSSANMTIRVPYVLRLKEYIDVRKRRRNTQMKRNRIFLRDKHRCLYCLKKFVAKDLTLDHIIPRSKGGISSPENLVSSCFPCNQKKSDRTPEEAGMPMKLTNRQLTTSLDKVVSVHLADINPIWKPYMGMTETAEGDTRYQYRD